MSRLVGFLINPVAGMGGKVALKGTDGQETLFEALRRGAVPEAGKKAERSLSRLAEVREKTVFLTAPGAMGEEALSRLGFQFRVVCSAGDAGGRKKPSAPCPSESASVNLPLTSAGDTIAAARAIRAAGAEFLLFAGGDGTARDLCQALGTGLPVIGIPAGVKIQSAVFARTPEEAGDLAARILRAGEASETGEPVVREAAPETGESAGRGPLPERPSAPWSELCVREVVDLDEDLYRKGQMSAKIYGLMATPKCSSFQNIKQGGFSREAEALAAIGAYVAEGMEPGVCYAIGSGSNAKAAARALGIQGELLGVDVIRNRELILRDASEAQLWELSRSGEMRAVVSPIGGQGFLFGRGNHQFSPRVLRNIGRKGITVAATVEKLLSIRDGCLRVDCGDEDLERELLGYYNIVCGYKYFLSFPCRRE